MLRWLRDYIARREERSRAVEEKEFFDAQDEFGAPDYDAQLNPIEPVWNEASGTWTYPDRHGPDFANPG